MPRALTWITTVLMSACLAALAGCGTDPAPEKQQESDMTPDQALTALQEAATELVSAAAPDAEVQLTTPDDVPCGGLGGNEFTQLKYTLQGVAARTQVDDRDQALATVLDRAGSLGLTAREQRVRSDRVDQGFDGDGFVVVVQVYDNGAVAFDAETACLDNPDE